ncbi:MAG TPA: hypothetical protein VFB63_25560 [Bryobacteraceae bacterium]|nr:hypothetical protein [Bryobacteraceae bacterium]
MRALLGRVSKLEDALAAEIQAHGQNRIAEALQRLSEEQLEWLKSASEAHRMRRPFTNEERTAMRAYEGAVLSLRGA